MSALFLRRRLNDMKMLHNNPEDFMDAYPDPDDLNKWYFLLTNFKNCDYEGGYYLGIIILDDGYPFKAGSIRMLTPSGRFNINKNICVTATSYHQNEYIPAWNIKTLVIAFQSIMSSDNQEDHGLSHIRLSETSHEKRKEFAKNTIKYNIENHFDIITKFNRFIDDKGYPLKTIIMPEKKTKNNDNDNITSIKEENKTKIKETETNEATKETETNEATKETETNEATKETETNEAAKEETKEETIEEIKQIVDKKVKKPRKNTKVEEIVEETKEETIEELKQIVDKKVRKPRKNTKVEEIVKETKNQEKIEDTKIQEKPKRKYTRKSQDTTNADPKPRTNKKSSFLGI
ncbi:ubiquitin-conjugating enzyme E2 [Hokovirus HKV1]|uniref:E2 ubiquitin-conjugating enzyme n=1 Tax=Hokovirus HKV1 TaxID=1977638 RepID=A0A1V0SGU0_9VIRU|nr:ubiquitin-conjugating enzyme E2 [Hokovirus HKV1]